MQSYSEIHRKKRFLLFDALTIARLNEQVLTAQVYDHFQFQTEPVKICFRICPEIRIITADPQRSSSLSRMRSYVFANSEICSNAF